MMVLSAMLTDSQIMELAQNVEITDYVEYMHMIDWNEYMNSSQATEIIDSIDPDHFDTSDEYVVMDGQGRWVSSDSLNEILEPFLDDMLQDYLDSNL